MSVCNAKLVCAMNEIGDGSSVCVQCKCVCNAIVSMEVCVCVCVCVYAMFCAMHFVIFFVMNLKCSKLPMMPTFPNPSY